MSANTTFPRPYRYGPAQFNVGLRPLESEWLPSGICSEKKALLDLHKDAVFCALHDSTAAQAEAASLIARSQAGAEIHQNQTLHDASYLTEADLVLMQKSGTDWACTAACLCAPTFFSPQHAVGKSLSQLHAPVPGGSPELAGRISRVFNMLREDLVLERLNWTVQLGPERNTPSRQFLIERARKVTHQEAMDLLHLRVERQTIRLLPMDQSILFTIGVTTEPLRAILIDPLENAVFRRAWETTSEAVSNYKGWADIDGFVRAMW
jgi:dimethylamine monooxygenase subunit A